MPIKWKKSNRFKPEVILEKIDNVRTVGADGGVSFSGMEIEEYLPILHSLLAFPSAAQDIDTSTLIWKGLGKSAAPLTKDGFLKAVNTQLDGILDSKEQQYVLLTEISLDPSSLPKVITREDAKIRFLPNGFPTKFRKARAILLSENRISIQDTPHTYCKCTVTVKAKSPASAVNKAIRALDIQRGLWCLVANPGMQVTFGTVSFKPVNVVRMGGKHTLHQPNGEAVISTIWFEPEFKPAEIPRLDKPAIMLRNSNYAIKCISASRYGDRVFSALTRYARALDEGNPNTAFLRLWGALEALTTPDKANYDNVVSRCAFLYEDIEYHRQVLEHLREYRNDSVHAGLESDKARTHCYQLQRYFRDMFWFHVRNATYFTSLEEANLFLDSSISTNELKRELQLTRKAVRFRNPKRRKAQAD